LLIYVIFFVSNIYFCIIPEISILQSPPQLPAPTAPENGKRTRFFKSASSIRNRNASTNSSFPHYLRSYRCRSNSGTRFGVFLSFPIEHLLRANCGRKLPAGETDAPSIYSNVVNAFTKPYQNSQVLDAATSFTFAWNFSSSSLTGGFSANTGPHPLYIRYSLFYI
jgi:hypothetical protein